MGYCNASDVRVLIETELDDEVIEQMITLADAEVDRQLGGASPDASFKRQCSMYLAASILADKDPASYTTGNIRIDLGRKAQEWRALVKADILEARAGTTTVKSSSYQHINEDLRYPNE